LARYTTQIFVLLAFSGRTLTDGALDFFDKHAKDCHVGFRVRGADRNFSFLHGGAVDAG